MICDRLSDIMKFCVFPVSEYKSLYVLDVLAKALRIQLGIHYPEFSLVFFFPFYIKSKQNVPQALSKIDRWAKSPLIKSPNINQTLNLVSEQGVHSLLTDCKSKQQN